MSDQYRPGTSWLSRELRDRGRTVVIEKEIFTRSRRTFEVRNLRTGRRTYVSADTLHRRFRFAGYDLASRAKSLKELKQRGHWIVASWSRTNPEITWGNRYFATYQEAEAAVARSSGRREFNDRVFEIREVNP